MARERAQLYRTWKHPMATALFFALAVVTVSIPLRAENIAISLPLQGHYHPGRYMPVRISGQTDVPSEVLTLRAGGALTTEIHGAGGRINATVPWLSVLTVSDVYWKTSAGDHAIKLPLHALDDDDDRLIGYVGADADALAALPGFKDKKLYRVELNITDPLPGDIMAWEGLDGIVLDAAAARQKDTADKIRALLAGGTAVAIRSKQKPGGNWPWKKQGAYWIAQIHVAGKSSAYEDEIAYLPTQTWVRGWPFDLRRKILLAAVILILLGTGAALWRSRWAVLIVVALGATATAFAFYWRSRQPVGIERSWCAVIRTDTTTQRDRWTYQAVLRPADVSFPWQTLTRPVFASPRQAENLSVRQICDFDGTPRAFIYHLEPRQALAFQTRSLLAERENLSPVMPIHASLRKVADELYAMHGDRIVGQVSAPDDESQWPDVVIDRLGQ